MKKILPLTVSFFIGAASYGQITFNSTDLIPLGQDAYQVHDSTPAASILPGGMGNQTWNFSALNNHGVDTLMFRNPAPFPLSSNFPAANFGLQIGSNPQWIFMLKNSTGLYSVGNSGDFMGTGDTIAMTYTNYEKFLGFPSNYTDSYMDTSAYWFKGPFSGPPPGYDSIMVRSTSWQWVSIDAYGMVTTPLGTFNSLRKTDYTRSIDSIFLRAVGPVPPAGWYFVTAQGDTTTHFQWWSNDPAAGGFPIVEMDFDSITMASTSAEWLLTTPVASLAPIAVQAEVSVFPNPANDLLTISMKDEGLLEIKIFDAAGREIMNRITSVPICISTLSFDNGVYLYRVVGKDGQAQSGKFIINR